MNYDDTPIPSPEDVYYGPPPHDPACIEAGCHDGRLTWIGNRRLPFEHQCWCHRCDDCGAEQSQDGSMAPHVTQGDAFRCIACAHCAHCDAPASEVEDVDDQERPLCTVCHADWLRDKQVDEADARADANRTDPEPDSWASLALELARLARG